MVLPEHYYADQFRSWGNDVEINGHWYFARPVRRDGLRLRWRLWLAWKVFVGKFDVVEFAQNQKPMISNVAITVEEYLADYIDKEALEMALKKMDELNRNEK